MVLLLPALTVDVEGLSLLLLVVIRELVTLSQLLLRRAVAGSLHGREDGSGGVKPQNGDSALVGLGRGLFEDRP